MEFTGAGKRLFSVAVLPRLAGLAHATDTDPGPQEPLELVPSTRDGRWTFFHVNVVIPHLPEPHRYLGCMTLLGHTGTRVFDDDRAVQGTPRNTATATIGTAVTAGADGYRTYDVGRECDLDPGGAHWRLGDGFELDGAFPTYRTRLRRTGLAVDLDVVAEGPVTWFARAPIYDHVGYPARATGTIEWRGERTVVDAPCSLEYARATSSHAALDRTTPPVAKLPWDFFCYQVLALDAHTLLLLTRVGVLGRPAFSSIIVWQEGGEHSRWCGPVHLDVLAHDPDPPRSPSGVASPVATRVRWRWDEPAGPSELTLDADTTQLPGVGTGWIAGWSFHGTHRGQPVEGRAYGEFADRRRR